MNSIFLDCKTIDIGDLKAGRCSLPFQDCRLEIKRQKTGIALRGWNVYLQDITMEPSSITGVAR